MLLNPNASERRIRTLRIAPDFLLEVIEMSLQPQPWVYEITCNESWPEDLHVQGTWVEYSPHYQIILLVSSATFAEVPDGTEPPDWVPQFTRHDLPRARDALTGILANAVQARGGRCLICNEDPALYCGAGCANRGR